MDYTPDSGRFPKVGMNHVPIGMYHVTYFPHQKAKRLVDTVTLARMGIDFLATPVGVNDADLVELCEKLGMGLLIEYNDDNGPEAVVSAFQDSPAVFGHLVSDDIDVNFANRAAFEAAVGTYNGYNANWITCGSMGNAANTETFAGLSDWLAVQCYPISAESLATPHIVYPNFVAKTAPYDQPAFGNVQCFKFSGDRYPTPGEVEVMSWQALCLGCTGVIYYTFFDPNNDLATQPGIRAAIMRFVRAVRKFERLIVQGTREEAHDANGMTCSWTLTEIGQRLDVVLTYATESVDVKLRAL